MAELKENELDLAAGINWEEFAGGLGLGLVTLGIDVIVPEASPWVSRIGFGASAKLIASSFYAVTPAYA
ncbi:MAG: hypothetical protein ACYCYO_11250 [Bacilli bacterium]